MSDYLKDAIEKVIRDTMRDIQQQAKRMRSAVDSCSHQEIYRDEKLGEYRCLNCQQKVYPDPEGLKWHILEYGQKRDT